MTTGGWFDKCALPLFTAATLVATGCGAPGNVRAVHASPDTPPVSVALRLRDDGNLAAFIPSLAYRETSSYQKVGTDGQYAIELRPVGATPDSLPLLTSSYFYLHHGENVTVFIAGLSQSSDPSVGLRIFVQPEDFGAPQAKNGRVVFVNTSVDAATVSFSIPGGPAADVPLFGTSSPPGVLLPAGQTLQIVATAAGSATPIRTAFTVPPLADQSQGFVIAIGLTAAVPRQDDAFDLLAIGPNGTIAVVKQNPIVYALQASPDVPAVDLFSGDTLVASDLSFAELSAPFQWPPGDYRIDVFPHAPAAVRPSGAPIGSFALSGLEAGQRYLAVTSGFARAGRVPAFAGAVYVEQFSIAPTMPELRIIQASPVMPLITMGTVGSGPFVPIVDFSNLEFLAATPPAGTPVPTAFLLGAAPAGSPIATAEFALMLRPDERAFGVAAGVPQPMAGEPGLVLVLVDTTTRPWTAARIPNIKGQ